MARELEKLLDEMGVDPEAPLVGEDLNEFTKKAGELISQLNDEERARLIQQTKAAAGHTTKDDADFEFMRKCLDDSYDGKAEHPGEIIHVTEVALLQFLRWAYLDVFNDERGEELDFMSFALGLTAGMCVGQEMTERRHA